MNWFKRLFKIKEPCRHPNADCRKWLEDDVCMVYINCPDCGWNDIGPVMADPKDWTNGC